MEDQPFDLESLDAPRQRWVEWRDGVEFLVRIATPLQLQVWRRGLVDVGIMRETRGGNVEIARGREKDYYIAIAKEWVIDWRGPIRLGGQLSPAYDAKHMGRVLWNRKDILERVNAAVEGGDDFPDSAAQRPSAS